MMIQKKKFRQIVLLAVLGLLTMVTGPVFGLHLSDHRCKLGVTAVFIPSTLYLAGSMYKKEMLELYKKKAVDNGESLTFRACIRKYNKEFSYQAFLEAYGRYLKQSITGSFQWKQENKLFCTIVQTSPIFFGGAAGIDYLMRTHKPLSNKPLSKEEARRKSVVDLLKNAVTCAHAHMTAHQKGIVTRLNLDRSDLMSFTSSEVDYMNTLTLQLTELEKRIEQENLNPSFNVNRLTPEERKSYEDIRLISALLGNQERFDEQFSRMSLADARNYINRWQSNAALTFQPQPRPQPVQRQDQLTPEEDRLYQQELARQTAHLARQGFRLTNPSWRRNSWGGIELTFRYKEDRSVISPDFGFVMDRVPDRKIIDCSICSRSSNDETDKVGPCTYVFPCQKKVNYKTDGTLVTPCSGATEICDACVADLCREHDAKCPLCRDSLR